MIEHLLLAICPAFCTAHQLSDWWTDVPNFGLNPYQNHSSSFDVDVTTATTMPEQVTVCSAACAKDQTCAGFTLIKVTPTSGLKVPLCCLYTLLDLSAPWYRKDDNMECGSKAQLTPVPPYPISPLNFTCSDPQLEATFQWMKAEALQWVQTNSSPGFMPSFWAGYPDRAAFYLRDFAHQSVGAHLLGLRAENLAMARLFANTTSADLAWFCPWSFGFDGSIFALDFRSKIDFVHELPEPFDLLHRLGGLLLWDGGREWYQDPTLVSFYNHVAEDFLALHLPNATGPFAGVAGCSLKTCSQTGDIFKGVATYNEQAGHPLQYAADALAAQYAASLALASLYTAQGNAAASAKAAASAEQLRAGFLATWAVPNGTAKDGAAGYARGFEQGSGEMLSGWPKDLVCSTEIIFMAITGLLVGGTELADRTLDLLTLRGLDTANTITECRAQIPEGLFRYGRPDPALTMMRDLMQDPRRTYPEVSYAFVDLCVTGILGIKPDAPGQSVSTTLRLPSDLSWAQANHITIGHYVLSMSHQAGVGSTLEYLSWTGGSDSGSQLLWRAGIAGKFAQLWVDGVPAPAVMEFQEGDSRLPVSWVNVTLVPGQSLSVYISGGL